MLKRMLESEAERKRVQREKRAQWHQEKLKGSLREKILRCMAEAERVSMEEDREIEEKLNSLREQEKMEQEEEKKKVRAWSEPIPKEVREWWNQYQ